MRRIRFQGNEYLLIGDENVGGAIATREQYEDGECSYAHLFPDGSILQFGTVIGTIEDIVFIGEEIEDGAEDEPDPTKDVGRFLKGIVGPTWEREKEGV